ncbi:MAG: Rrf2 family transcriptional regulator [Firmicutes bacterium]|nr:Rrf2 family transcriptional regulator [Bacillota bacterium]
MEIIKRHTDYALRALAYLALHANQVVTAGEIAESQEVPLEFLQKILQRFVKSGMVKSHRGAQGGFSLAQEPAEITVLNIVEVMQGPVVMNRCLLGKNGCPRAPKCPLKKSWIDMEEKIAAYMSGITLQDLVDELRAIK